MNTYSYHMYQQKNFLENRDLEIIYIFDGLDLVSKEIIENNFNDKKEIKANI